MLRQIIEDEKVNIRVRLDAAKTILDRANLIPAKAPDAPDTSGNDYKELGIAELHRVLRHIEDELAKERSSIIDVTPGAPQDAPLALQAPSAA